MLSSHFKNFAELINKKFKTSDDFFVVEVGSNDGVLLKPLKDLGVKCLGIDPSVNVSKIAMDKGLDVINDFFDVSNAKKIISKYSKADVITGSNVFAHIDNMEEIMNSVKILLKDDGVFIMEVHYLMNLIE